MKTPLGLRELPFKQGHVPVLLKSLNTYREKVGRIPYFNSHDYILSYAIHLTVKYL